MLLLDRLWKLDSSWLKPINVRLSGDPLHQQLWSNKLGLMILLVAIVLTADYIYSHPAIAYFIFFLCVPQLWMVYTESLERAILSLA